MEHSVARGRVTTSVVIAGRACVWGRFEENASRLGEGDLRLPLVAASPGVWRLASWTVLPSPTRSLLRVAVDVAHHDHVDVDDYVDVDVNVFGWGGVAGLLVGSSLDLRGRARENNAVHIIGPDNQKLAIVMVGLPARGKSYTARRIERYLSWLGYRTRVFNVGQYRRVRVGAQMPHDFFDPKNPKGEEARKQVAVEALNDMVDWLSTSGHVGIYDATNSTRARRALVRTRCEQAG